MKFTSFTSTRSGHLFTGVCVSLAGIAAVALSVILMTSCCAMWGLFWTNISLIIPPILLGIGIDDMFVIIQTMKLEKAAEMRLQRPVGAVGLDLLIGSTAPEMARGRDSPSDPNGHHRRRQRAVTTLLSGILGKVGLSIFVTSLSDVLAFIVGSSFIMPATSSLCVWLGVGISFIFILMNTFFIACVALIERYRMPRWKEEVESVGRDDDVARADEKAVALVLGKDVALANGENDAPLPVLDKSGSSKNTSVSQRLRQNCSLRERKARGLDLFAHLFSKYYVPFAVTPGFLIFAFLSTVGLLAVCLYGVTQVRMSLCFL